MADKKISALTGASTPLAGTEVLPIVQSGATVKVAVSDLTAGRAVGGASFNTETAAAKVTLSGTSLTASGTDALININLLPKGSDKAVVIGSAEAGEHRALIMNGVAAKATYINFQQSGVDKWLFGQGAATNSNNLEVYNTGGVITIVIDKTSNDVTINGGNLVIGTAGKGIDFSATTSGSGTMTSELLADYEEGTWTPAFAAWTTAPTFSDARYIKIGSQVTVVMLGQSGVNAGNQAITGLPFTNSNAVTPTGALKVFGSSTLSSLCNVDASATSINSFSAATLTGNYWSLSITYFVTF